MSRDRGRRLSVLYLFAAVDVFPIAKIAASTEVDGCAQSNGTCANSNQVSSSIVLQRTVATQSEVSVEEHNRTNEDEISLEEGNRTNEACEDKIPHCDGHKKNGGCSDANPQHDNWRTDCVKTCGYCHDPRYHPQSDFQDPRSQTDIRLPGDSRKSQPQSNVPDTIRPCKNGETKFGKTCVDGAWKANCASHVCSAGWVKDVTKKGLTDPTEKKCCKKKECEDKISGCDIHKKNGGCADANPQHDVWRTNCVKTCGYCYDRSYNPHVSCEDWCKANQCMARDCADCEFCQGMNQGCQSGYPVDCPMDMPTCENSKCK